MKTIYFQILSAFTEPNDNCDTMFTLNLTNWQIIINFTSSIKYIGKGSITVSDYKTVPKHERE